MKGIKILLAIMLIGTIVSSMYAKPVEVYLLPSSPGEPSKIVPVDKASAWWLIQYDGGESNYYLSGLLPDDTLGVFFIPPAACSLFEVHFIRYNYIDGSPAGYTGIVADVPDGVTLGDFGEYHYASSMPGPSCIGTYLAGPEAMEVPYTGDWVYDTLDVPGDPDVGTDAFWAGWTIEDTAQSTRIDAGDATTPHPLHAVGFKQGGLGPETNGPGWYPSWHLFWVRALVKVYQNIGPVIEPDELLGTYNTGLRTVDIYTEDFGPAAAGIDDIVLKYYVDPTDTQEVAVVNDSLDVSLPNFEYGWWHADIPGQAAGCIVHYWAEGTDYEGAGAVSDEYVYLVGEGTAGNALLYTEADYGWGVGHDAYTGQPWDLWDEGIGGVADNTVTDFYAIGAGGRAFSWLAFSGFTIAEWSFTTDFSDFMDAGGCIFLCGQDIPGGGYELGYEEWVAPSPHPLPDYFKANGGTDDYIADDTFTVFVDNTDLLTTGMNDELQVSPPEVGQATWTGIFTDIDLECVPLFFDGEGNILGYRYESAKGFKVVFLYFPFNAILTTGDQDIFIQNLTDWFGYVGIEEEPEVFVYDLPRVSPNPLSRPTTVSFSVPKTDHVSVKVYDVTGSLVSNLVDENLSAGTHYLTIDTENLSSGVYFLKMDSGDFSGTSKFTVMK